MQDQSRNPRGTHARSQRKRHGDQSQRGDKLTACLEKVREEYRRHAVPDVRQDRTKSCGHAHASPDRDIAEGYSLQTIEQRHTAERSCIPRVLGSRAARWTSDPTSR